MLSQSDRNSLATSRKVQLTGVQSFGMQAALNACLESMEYRDNQTHVLFLGVAQA